MACTERVFFGVPIARDQPGQLADNWAGYRNSPGVLIFARSYLLWRLARSKMVRTFLTAPRDAVIPLGGPARHQVFIATGCTTSTFVPLQSVVRILSRAEEDGAAIFIVDRTAEGVRNLEDNTRATFPGLPVVGRARITPSISESVTTAIRKADPRIVLVGADNRFVLRWVAKNLAGMGNPVVIIAPDAVAYMVGNPRRGVLRDILDIPAGILTFPVLLGHRFKAAHRNRNQKTHSS